MSTSLMQEIPQARWQDYFTLLADWYAGWAVTAEVLATEVGDQRVIDGLPLQGISYEAKGGSQAGDVLIGAGDAGTPFVSHLVRRPRAIRVAVTQPGEETDFEADGEDGFTTLVRLRRLPQLPPPGKA